MQLSGLLKQAEETARNLPRPVLAEDAVAVAAAGGAGVSLDGVNAVAFVVVDEADVAEVEDDDVSGVQDFGGCV